MNTHKECNYIHIYIMTNKEKEIVLAFDIEHTGTEIIAIGASVVDSDFKQLDSFFLGIYVPNDTTFSDRCYNSFWSNHLDVLEKLKYNGNQEKSVREYELIKSFQEFRAKWSNAVLVTDNNVFDGGLVNELIKKYLIGVESIPYSASKLQEYSPFWETFSQQKGLLFAVDPKFKSDWGLSHRIFELYDVQKPTVDHDHNPVNDAYTIAYDQQVLFGIRDGRIKLK